MMIDRLRKAQRLRALQLARERLAEWACATLESEAARIEDQRTELLEVLDRGTLPVAIAPNVVMRHLRSLAERHAALVDQKREGAERWRQERAQLRTVEQIVEVRLTEVGRAEEAAQLAAALEVEVERWRNRQRQG